MFKQAINLSMCCCDKGSSPSVLAAQRVMNLIITGQPAANIADVGFFAPFGVCSITNTACVAAPAGLWSSPPTGLQLGGYPALGESATLQCVSGGVIELVSATQSTVDLGLDPPEEPSELAADVATELGEASWSELNQWIGRSIESTSADTASSSSLAKNLGRSFKIKGGAPGVVTDLYSVGTAESKEERVEAIGEALGGTVGTGLVGAVEQERRHATGNGVGCRRAGSR